MTEAEVERRRVLQHGTALEKLEAILGQKNVKPGTLRKMAMAALAETKWKAQALSDLIGECDRVVEMWDKGDLATAVNWMREAAGRARRKP
jgi:hypothetical protein